MIWVSTQASYLSRTAIFLAIVIAITTIHGFIAFDAVHGSAYSSTELPNFVITGYSFLSSAKGPVYPGSKNAELRVSAEYYGLDKAENIHACISLPEGFTVDNACVSAKNENGDINETAKFGAVRYFTYSIDVDRSVEPGNYTATITIKYSISSSSREETYTLVLRISPYPKPRISIEKARLTPLSYPATLGTSLELTILNNGSSSVVSGYADIILPPGFKPQEAAVDVPALTSNGGRGTITINDIFIEPSVAPGNYTISLELHLTMRTNDGVEYTANQTIKTSLEVKEPIEPLVSTIDAGWASGKIYPGTRRATLYIQILNLDDLTIAGVEGWIYLPEGFKGPNGTTVVHVSRQNINIGFGESLRLDFNNIDIDDSVAPGNYTAVLRLRLHVAKEGAETILWYNKSINIRVWQPTINLSLIDAGWRQEAILSEGAVDASLYVTLQFLGKGTLRAYTATLYLENALTRYNATTVTAESDNLAVGYGSTFTLVFNGIKLNKNTSTLKALLEVKAVVELEEGGVKIFKKKFNITARTIKEEPIVLLESHVEYNGQPAPILASARNLVLRITLLNTMPTTITSISLDVKPPEWMQIESIVGSCLSGVPAGSTCTISVTFNVSSNAIPGSYILGLLLRYYYYMDDTISHSTQKITIPLEVEDLESYSAIPLIISWYWGTEGNPVAQAYAGSADTPLTIIIYNPSRWDIDRILVSLKPKNYDVKVLDKALSCRLPSLSTCSLTYHLDLREAMQSEYTILVEANYTQTVFATHFTMKTDTNITVSIASLSPQGITIISYGWEGGHKVFPGSTDATLTVTLANNNPWSLQGAEIELLLPEGIKPHGSSKPLTHVGGPIASLATFTASFELDISRDLRPGTYKVPVFVKYWYNSGGVLVEKTGRLEISIKVDDPNTLFKYLRTIWVGGSPKPGDRGVRYVISIRVIDPDEVQAPILKLNLPPGFKDAYSNSSSIIVIPGQPIAPTIPQLSQITPSSMSQAIAAILSSQQSMGQLQGQVVQYTIAVNIDDKIKPGAYTAEGEISFMDYWGTIHTAVVEVSLYVPGGARYLHVWSKPSSDLINGTAIIEVYVENNGTAPVYNVYMVLAPQTPNAYPLDAVRFFKVLAPGETKKISYRVVFNPTTPWSSGSPSYTFAGFLAIVYQDYSGSMQSFNATISAILRPPVVLKLTTAKAEYSNGSLKVSISIANLGSLQAKRTLVKAYAAEKERWSLVGDIDPGNEIPVRIEFKELARPPKKVKIIIETYDEYNNIYTFSYEIAVKVISIAKTSTAKKESSIIPGQMELVTAGMVAAFLAISGVLIYRLVKRHQESLAVNNKV